MAGRLRFEAWTVPGVGTLEKIRDIPVMEGASGTRELSQWGDLRLPVPSDWDHFDDLLSDTAASIVRVVDGDTVVDECFVERLLSPARRPGQRVISGRQVAGAVEWVGIYPYGWPNHNAEWPDWIWGGENVLTNPGFEDNETVSEIWELWHDHTGGTFTITYAGSETTAAIDYNATAGEVENAIEALASITDVVVSGSGSQSDPWRVELVDPHFSSPDLSADGSSLTGGTTIEAETIQQGGSSPSPWTKSQNADESTDPDIHGTYASDGFRLTQGSEPVRSGSRALRVNGLSRYAGAQQVVTVTPGATYQPSVWVRSSDASVKFTLVIRRVTDDGTGTPIAQNRDVQVTAADTWTEITITDAVIPDDVDEVIFRIAVTSTGNPDPFYIDDASLTEGLAATTPGEIVRLLVEAAQTRGALDWLDLSTFSDSADSAGNAWQDSALSFTAFAGSNLGAVLDDLHRLGDTTDGGYEWRIVPKSTPSGGLTHDLEVYNPGGGGTDYTTSSGAPTITTGAVADAELVQRSPSFTAVLAEGEDVYSETTDGTLETNFGRRERMVRGDGLADATSLGLLADALFGEQASNLRALSAQLRGDGLTVPGVDFREGDTIWWQLPGLQSRIARRVRRYSWSHGTPATYEVQGSRVLSEDGGLADAVRYLLRRFEPRRRDRSRRQGQRVSVGGSQGARLHLTRSAAQTIAVGGEAISWDTVHISGVALSDGVPLTEVTVDQDGYYDLQVALAWSSFLGGGSVSVVRKRNGVDSTVWPPPSDPGIWASSAGQRGEWTAKAIPCQSGDTLRVVVDHQDASTQDLASATLVVELVDRAAPQETSGVECTAGDQYSSTTTAVLPLPTCAQPGDLYLLAAMTANDAFDSYPSGWTALVDNALWGQSAGYFSVLYRVADGSEGSDVSLGIGGNGAPGAYASWVIKGPVDWSTYPPEVSSTTKNKEQACLDMPAVTPSHGSGLYLVFPFICFNTSNADSPPPGYESLVLAESGDTSEDRGIWVASADVGIQASEDPGDFCLAGGGLTSRIGGATIAVKAQ